METRKSISFLLLIALLTSGLLLAGCSGGDDTEEVTTGGTARQVELKVTPSGLRFALADWNAATDAQKTLTATLTEPKDASYQWYSRASSTGDGTAIPGAASASYKPDISAVGNYYYYVEVSVEGKTLTSGTALIQIVTAITPAPTEFKIGGDRLNYVRGVGGTGSFMFRAGNGDASPDADVEYIDLLMGELGANILRIMVQDDFRNYVTNSVQSKNSEQFYHDARKNFFAVIRRVNELGGYVFANPWTAPAEFKTPNSLIGTGSILTRNGPNYVDYAEHLREFLKWLNENNAPIFAIGILNEPDFGQTAGYEGMGMSGSDTRDWFKTVGNFTTQYVTNRQGASTTGSIFAPDIIPGHGGGGSTHHVLVMSGDSMGDITSYMNPQLNDPDANNYIELMGRHYYAASNRYTRVAGNIDTEWRDRPQAFGTSADPSNYKGPYEAESLAKSPQMYAPGSTAGNIKREIWQTEHDINMGSSTRPPDNNAQTFWNCVFGPLNEIDWCLRANGESVYDWWYSSSYSGFVTSWSQAGFPPHTITPRGRAFAHYARYVNETWYLPITQTKTSNGISFNNVTSLDANSIVPKINAFEDVNGKFISVVLYAPTAYGSSVGGGIGGGATGNLSNEPGFGSTNVGSVSIILPDGFTATEATAIRSYGWDVASNESWDSVPAGTPRYWIDEPVFLSTDKKSVEVTLPGGNVISIMVKGSWSGSREFASPERVRPYTVK